MMKNLKTFEDACNIEGLDSKKVIPDFTCYPEADRKSAESNAKLMIVVKAANRVDNDGKEWIADYSDGSWKYEPYFVMDEGSSGFRYNDYDYWVTFSCVGSRLCFKSSELAEYISTQFIDLYRDVYMR